MCILECQLSMKWGLNQEYLSGQRRTSDKSQLKHQLYLNLRSLWKTSIQWTSKKGLQTWISVQNDQTWRNVDLNMDLKWSNMKLCGPQVAFKIDLKRTSKNLSEPKKLTNEPQKTTDSPQKDLKMDLKLTFLQFSCLWFF